MKKIAFWADVAAVAASTMLPLCVAHLVTDGVAQRNGVYRASNLPGYILGSGRIQVGFSGTMLSFR